MRHKAFVDIKGRIFFFLGLCFKNAERLNVILRARRGPNVSDPVSVSVDDGYVVYHVLHAGSTPGSMPRQVTF